MSLPQPTRARLRSLTLAGTNLSELVKEISVYENILKPYHTAKITLVDNVNLIDNLNLVGGEPCSFSFDAGEGRIYENTLYLLQISGERSHTGLRAQRYQIDLIGREYFQDRQNLVQRSFRGIPGTSVISQIHSQYFGNALRVLASSLGPLSQHAYVVSSRPPLTAIEEIRRRLTYGQFRTGNTLYFRDRDSHVLGPLESLFSNLSGPTFIQEATWGKDWFDVIRAQNAIIAAQANLDFTRNGRLGMNRVSAASNQEQRVFDWRQKREVVRNLTSRITAGAVTGTVGSLLSPILGGIAGGHGGLPNYQVMDTAITSESTDPSRNTMAERLYAAIARNGPGITVKVPIQSGLECTVGKGANLRLLPPMGDFDILTNNAAGLYLVVSLAHTLALDDRQFSATTTFEGIRGGVGT